jgi:hypothetical protein
MANISAIHSVGASLVTYLRNAYPAALSTTLPCGFRLISSGELARDDDLDTALTLFLHRVTINEHLRTRGRLQEHPEEKAPLAVDLHYLMSVWAGSALAEQTILGWAMRELHLHPVLDSAALSPEANWNQSDVVQIIPAELSNEDIMRIWDAITPSFRISVSYIARVVRIDPDTLPDARPVVASRFALTDREARP